jgi:hypothetical protein
MLSETDALSSQREGLRGPRERLQNESRDCRL